MTKGKSIDLGAEPVDVQALHRRVFDLEQDSVSKDKLISELRVKVADLETANASKVDRIDTLYAMFLDMKLRLTRKFGKSFRGLTGDDNDSDSSGDDGSAPRPTGDSSTPRAGSS